MKQRDLGQGRSRSAVAGIAMGVLALLLVSCSSGDDDGSAAVDEASSESEGEEPAEPDPDEERDRTLVVAVPDDIQNLDYNTGFGFPLSNEIFRNTYGRLIEYAITEDEEGRPVMDPFNFDNIFTDEVDISEDESTWTFHIQEGLEFASGRPVTAQDLYYYWERAIDLTGPLGTWTLVGVIPAEGDPLSNIEVIDDSTIRFTSDAGFNALMRPFLIQTAGQYLTDTELIRENATDDDPWATEWLAENAPGGGPYVIGERIPGERTVLDWNPSWPGFEPHFTRVIYRVVPSASDRISLLQRGDVDVAQGLTPAQMQDVDAADGARVESYAASDYLYMGFNQTEAPFDDVQVREAIAKALPYDEIIEQVYFGFANRMSAPVPDHLPGSAPDLSPLDGLTDEDGLAEASSILESLGYSSDNPLGFTLSVSQSSPEHEDIAAIIQARLAPIGVDVEIQTLPLAAYQEQKFDTQLDAFLDTFGAWIPEPSWFLILKYGENSFGRSSTGYWNESVEAMIREAIQEPDDERRAEIYREAQVMIMDDYPYAYVADLRHQVALRDEITYVHTPESLFRYAWMDRSG